MHTNDIDNSNDISNNRTGSRDWKNYMRNLLGWLETRPAQITSTYLKLA